MGNTLENSEGLISQLHDRCQKVDREHKCKEDHIKNVAMTVKDLSVQCADSNKDVELQLKGMNEAKMKNGNAYDSLIADFKRKFSQKINELLIKEENLLKELSKLQVTLSTEGDKLKTTQEMLS